MPRFSTILFVLLFHFLVVEQIFAFPKETFDGQYPAHLAAAPTITDVSPRFGPPGTLVTITGTNLASATEVSFFRRKIANFTIVSPTSITAIVPATALTGFIQIVTPDGTVMSGRRFNVGNFVVMGNAPLGSGAQATACGSIHTDGGLDEDYTSDSRQVQTLLPDTAGHTVKLSFTSFNLVSPDTLYIYDGTNSFTRPVAKYSGSRPFPFSVEATTGSGALTLKFISNNTGNSSGWEAGISCTQPPAIKIADIYPRMGLATGSSTTGTKLFISGSELQQTMQVVLTGLSAPFLYNRTSRLLEVTVPFLAVPTRPIIKSIFNVSDTADAFFYPFGRKYCTPTTPGRINDGVLSVVATGTNFRNTSGVGQAGFPASQYPPIADSLRLDLGRGRVQELILKTNPNYQPLYVSVDFNGNGAFEPTELFTSSRVNTDPVSRVAIQVPVAARLGPTLMRISASLQGVLYLTSCASIYSFELEDYLVNITAPDPQYVFGIAPIRGKPGATFKIFGQNLNRATGIKINGIPVPIFSVVNDSTILATVPQGTGRGPVQVSFGQTIIQTDTFRITDPNAFKVLLLYNENNPGIDQNNHRIVQSLLQYNDIEAVDSLMCRTLNLSYYPPIDSLLQYKAILVCNYHAWSGPTFVGRALNTALNAGVGVVQTGASAGADSLNGFTPDGPWNRHQLIQLRGFNIDAPRQQVRTMGAHIAGHPLLENAYSFRGDDFNARPIGAPRPGCTSIATWSDGSQLVVARDYVNNAARRVDLGFSAISNESITDSTKSNYRLLYNSLKWVNDFTVRRIQYFLPDTAVSGDTVLVSGNFSGIQALSINGLRLNFTVESSTRIRFIMPDNALTGRLVATGQGWIDTSRATVNIPPRPQFITLPATRGSVGTPYIYQPRITYPAAWPAAYNVLYTEGPSWLKITGALGKPLQVRTIAGTGRRGQDNGPADSASFLSPESIVKYKDGFLISDFGMLRFFKLGDSVTTFAGSTLGYRNGSISTALFDVTQGLAVDTDGTIYLADGRNYCIRKIDKRGMVTTLAGGPRNAGFVDGNASQARFGSMYGITLHKNYLYIADNSNYAVRRVSTLTGATITLAGSGQQGSDDGLANLAKFTSVQDVVILPNGEIMVLDFDKLRVIRGNQVYTYGNSSYAIANSKDLILDPVGNLIITLPNYIYYFDLINNRGEAYFRNIGYADGPYKTARFNGLRRGCIEGNTLYVADQGNGRIRAIDLLVTGEHKLFGRPPLPGSYPVGLLASGRFGNTKLNYTIAVDPCGTPTPLAIADTVCAGQPILLQAQGTGTFNWYLNDSIFDPKFTASSVTLPAGSPSELWLSQTSNCESPRIRVQASVLSLNAQFAIQGNRLAYRRSATDPAAATFQWFSNLVPIAGATDSVFTVATTGRYALRIGVANCADTSLSYFITVVGTKLSAGLRSLVLQPNPAADWLTIVLNGNWPSTNIAKLFDLTGRLVSEFTLKNGSNSLPLKRISAGLYNLRTEDGNIYKLVIK